MLQLRYCKFYGCVAHIVSGLFVPTEFHVRSVGLSVCPSVRPSVRPLVTTVNCGKYGKLDRIAVCGGGSMNACIRWGVQIPHGNEHFLRGGANEVGQRNA